ncbi:MAG: hypothetical protein K8S13_01135 [Desulfobacula sp.]|uniref:hypothetical protein n=1 Tax=Desulfobacula sp. TaxID=2593537 RepID=UPI0025C66464|nr:hypothetical protein [Desulfobacula sp.]MCD4718452.1 hypothetical protein [Desulfobacula sp.]
MFVDRVGILYFLKLFMHAQRDKGRSRLGLSPHTIPIAGSQGSFALLNAPGTYEGYAYVVGNSDSFINEVCARLLVEPGPSNFKEPAKNINCPVMLLICKKDNLASPDSYRDIQKTLGSLATIKKYPIGHFDIYKQNYFDQSFKDQIQFLALL